MKYTQLSKEERHQITALRIGKRSFPRSAGLWGGRPADAESRATCGHWEAYTLHGPGKDEPTAHDALRELIGE
ncbi:hypothetical protein HZ994_11985 [Akkermansiaceae bacterium]|nr:hypothetical protein HZ994_11985 [Akkermansiaceae bacterium]